MMNDEDDEDDEDEEDEEDEEEEDDDDDDVRLHLRFGTVSVIESLFQSSDRLN